NMRSKHVPGDWDKIIDTVRKNYKGDFQDVRREIASKHLGIDPKKIIFINHHRAHAYYAYYASPLRDKALILTADAWGDGVNASINVAGDKITNLCNFSNFIIGRLYRYITLILGMKPSEHEYKVMGLSAYAKSKYYQKALDVFKKLMYVDGLEFKYREVPSDLYFYFRNKLEGFRFDVIAGALQQYTQDILTDWASNALKITDTRKICFSGGVAMNIKAIMEIAKLPAVEDIFICPSPSDDSLAMGSAYVVADDFFKDIPLKSLDNAYLGLDINDTEDVIKQAYSNGYKISRYNPKEAADMIVKGNIIARCVGRNEFGARALGNRSILANPQKLEIVKTINEKIKSRDFWMPFAPSILSEKADDYLVNPKGLKSPYMTMAFETKPSTRGDLKAALHQYDLTTRPQVLERETNPQYHELIWEFYKLTGVGGVLNTSFNVHGEPIVQTAKDAFDVFERTGLDALVLGDNLIQKNEQK
ncbi:MAG: carbamoyl transferase, partial [Candidatus Omnitrophota bacterium]